jgi:hypothetical protein
MPHARAIGMRDVSTSSTFRQRIVVAAYLILRSGIVLLLPVRHNGGNGWEANLSRLGNNMLRMVTQAPRATSCSAV